MDITLDIITLKDQHLLNDEERTACAKIINWINQIAITRPDYIKEKSLDSKIYMPAGNWVWAPTHPSWSYVRDLKNLDLLRIFTSQFSGQSLTSRDFLNRERSKILESIAEIESSVIENINKKGLEYVESYLKTVHELPSRLHIVPPLRFGEVGLRYKNVIINYDTIYYQIKIKVLHELGLLNDRPDYTIIEIGSGYGCLAYHLLKILPNAKIILIDLPESLIFSSIYTSILSPSHRHRFGINELFADSQSPGFTYLPNFEFPELVQSGIKADLVINTLSMSEMTKEQVEEYGKGIIKLLKSQGVFFEQNYNNEGIEDGIDCKKVLNSIFPNTLEFGKHLGGDISLRSNNKENLKFPVDEDTQILTP